MSAIDRDQTIGFGVALGVHAALITIGVLGFFTVDRIVETTPALEVSLEGFEGPAGGSDSDIEIEDDPEVDPVLEAFEEEVTEDIAASSAFTQEAEKSAEAAKEAEAEARRAEEEAQKNRNNAAAQKRANEARKKAEAAKAAKAKKAEAARLAKKKAAAKAKAAREKAARERAAAKKRKQSLAKAAGGGGSNKSSAEIKSIVNASIMAKITPYWNKCRITGLETEKLVTVVTLRLNNAGRIRGAMKTRTLPNSITPGNRSQVARHKFCAEQSLKKAQPYKIPDGADVSNVVFEETFTKR